MSTIEEIQKVLPSLSTKDLREVETLIRQLYRERKVGLIYDDSYGTWTDEDQVSMVAESFSAHDTDEGAPQRDGES